MPLVCSQGIGNLLLHTGKLGCPALYSNAWIRDGRRVPRPSKCSYYIHTLSARHHIYPFPIQYQLRNLSSLPLRPAYQQLKPTESSNPLPRTVYQSIPSPPAELFGKWTGLVLDDVRLESEIDFINNDPSLLVNQSANADDISLWACLMDFAHRRHGSAGIWNVWKDFSARRVVLRDVGIVADFFRSSVLNIALEHDSSLESVYEYAQWLYRSHHEPWPRLYEDVISFCLDNGQFERAFQWHIRLIPLFDPGPATLSSVIKAFATSPDENCQATLEAMYISSRHRDLYDELLPFLHSNGMSWVARRWRDLLLSHRDFPQSSTLSRSYLKFLQEYYPKTLTEEELFAVRDPPRGSVVGNEFLPRLDTEPNVSRHYMHPGGNRRLRDSLGAKWFATSWTALDFSMAIVSRMGVREIGPLSLQAIGLREQNADGVRARLAQLQSLNLFLQPSNYSRAVCHFVSTRNDEMLAELLHTDIHPDVFDDYELQRKILMSGLAQGDWSKYKLIITVQAALDREVIQDTCDRLILHALSLSGDHGKTALKILNDILASSLPLSQSTCTAVFRQLCRNLNQPRTSKTTINTAISTCRRIAADGHAVPSIAWRSIIISLANTGCVEELETLCIELLQRYLDLRNRNGMMSVHSWDLAHTTRSADTTRNSVGIILGESEDVPASLSRKHHRHPIRRIFTTETQRAIVTSTLARRLARKHSAAPRPPLYGIRALRAIHEAGFPVRPSLVPESVVYALASVNAGTSPWLVSSINEIRQSCNEAWGSSIMPSSADMLEIMSVVGDLRAIETEDEKWSRVRAAISDVRNSKVVVNSA